MYEYTAFYAAFYAACVFLRVHCTSALHVHQQAWGVKPERKPAVQLVPEQMVELAAEIAPTGRATCRRPVSQSASGK